MNAGEREPDTRNSQAGSPGTLYLGLAALGTVVPYVFFVAHFRAEGFGLGAFISSLFANGAAGGFSSDVLISSLAFWAWLYRSKANKAWLFVLLNLSIGLSCAFPAYLYARERRLARAPNTNNDKAPLTTETTVR